MRDGKAAMSCTVAIHSEMSIVFWQDVNFTKCTQSENDFFFQEYKVWNDNFMTDMSYVNEQLLLTTIIIHGMGKNPFSPSLNFRFMHCCVVLTDVESKLIKLISNILMTEK